MNLCRFFVLNVTYHLVCEYHLSVQPLVGPTLSSSFVMIPDVVLKIQVVAVIYYLT